MPIDNDPYLDALLSDRLDPLFWSAQRQEVASAWNGHVPIAHWLVAAARPDILVELGVDTGVSYSAFCEGVVRSGSSTRCFAVDWWRGDEHAGFYGENVYTDFKQFHDERYSNFSKLLRMTFDEASAHFVDRSIDLLHIDGLHTYEAVSHDFETWLPKLSPRGVAVFHDTQERREGFGVWRIWEEVRRRYPSFEFTHSHGLGILCVGEMPPPAVLSICETRDDREIAKIQERFRHFGERWTADRREQQRRITASAERERLSEAHAKTLLAEREMAKAEKANAIAKALDRATQEQEAAIAATRRLAETERIAAVNEAVRQVEAHKTAALAKAKERAKKAKADALAVAQRQAETEKAIALAAAQDRAEAEKATALGLIQQKADAETTALQAKLREVQAANEAIQASLSWRVTKPVRALPQLARQFLSPLDRRRKRRNARRDYELLKGSRWFDEAWYLIKYPDVAAADFDPVAHYVRNGADEGRDPGPSFDTKWYLATNHDVRVTGVNPLAHFVKHGWLEGRAPSLQSESIVSPAGANREEYLGWIAERDALSTDDVTDLRRRLGQLEGPPLISVLMPVYNPAETFLREAIGSIVNQVYENWELCIADDCSTEPHVRKVLSEYCACDSRIKVVFRSENGHISRASNSALDLVTGDWVAMLDHDDVMRPHALAEVGLAIDRQPDAEIIYTDEDKIDAEGGRYEPHFKPDFSRELFRSQNYLNHLTVHRTSNIRGVGGWRPGFEGSQDYDLSLRIFERIDPAKILHIPKILYHWRAIDGSTALLGSQKKYAFKAGLRALQEHVKRANLPAEVEPLPKLPYYRVRFSVPDPAPLVSLIIPTRDNVELLRNCIDSIHEKTVYPNYEIIVVNNGSSRKQTFSYFDDLKYVKDVRILDFDGPFNFSAINNFSVNQAAGEIVGLINNDIEVISPDWLTEMVSWATQPDIGCVGAKLYFADDTIQHAGVILGVGGVAGHSHKRYLRDHLGYFSRLKVLQNLSAVTAACLIVRKSVYQQVGGLNDVELAVAFNDVDFCLKVREAGYFNVWTPYAELYHLESASRGVEDNPEKVRRFQKEINYMQNRWSLTSDPYYSPHLTRIREDFSLYP